jgi:hypothetical protein
MNTIQLAKIKQYLLKEIGDASKEPYSPIDTITDTEQDREYRFSTESGTIYQVDVITFYRGPNKPIVARVAFGITDKYGDVDYDTQTNKNDIYRIMSTIVSIVKKDLDSNPADVIEFHPNKRTIDSDSKRARAGIQVDTDPLDNARTQLYLKYIKGQFPNFEVTQTLDGDIQVDLRK